MADAGKSEIANSAPCPCGSAKPYGHCCAPFLNGESLPSTPEELMRSRYTAFALKKWPYLVETTDPQKQLEFSRSGSQAWLQSVEFVGLEVLNSEFEGNKGTVEFKAKFKNLGSSEIETHYEKSKFRKLDGRWYYRPI